MPGLSYHRSYPEMKLNNDYVVYMIDTDGTTDILLIKVV